MNRKHYLLELFNNVEDRFVVEAALSREEKTSPRPRPRITLFAAIIALALLLMGCVAVFLGLQQRKIGEISVTEQFDIYGNPVSQPEKTWYVGTMSGLGDSPARQASREWNEFCRSYQPPVITNDPDIPDILNQYEYTYHCFDQTMVERLLEISETYGLQLLGTRAVAQSWQRDKAFEVLGITSLVRQDAPATADYGACIVYPPYNFVCTVGLTLTGETVEWKEEALCEVYYLQSGYLAQEDVFYYDPQKTQEWEYTAADGTKLLLALWDTKGLIIAQRADSTMVIRLDLAWQQGVFLDTGTPLPTRQDLQQLADCFDYSIITRPAPVEGLQQTFDAIPDPYAPAEDYLPAQYASYSAYLEEHCLWPELEQYAFYDIDGDGIEDLITGHGDGFCIHWLTIRDGQVVDLTGGRSPMRLCENGIVESKDPGMELHIYMKILGPDPEVGTEMEHLQSVSYSGGSWKIDGQACTQEEAEACMAQYTPLELTWYPMMSFPMDDQGTTFGHMLAGEESPTGADLPAFYAQHYQADWDYTWFELRDINEDGIEDLLLSYDGVFIEAAYTCKRGKLVSLSGDFYLCRDNIQHSWDKVDRYNQGVLERHHFLRLSGDRIAYWYQLTHNLSTDTWEDTNYTAITQEQAQAFLDQYPQAELNMRPIQELTEG